MKKIKKAKQQPPHLTRTIFWFFLGASLGLFFFVSFALFYYKHTFQERIYPGIFVDGVDFSGKSKEDIVMYFAKKNEAIQQTQFRFTYAQEKIETTAKSLSLGYDGKLLAEQAYAIGRANNSLSSFYLLGRAYINGIYFPASYHYNEEALVTLLNPFQKKIDVEPIDAEFTISNGRVTEFRSHVDGRKVDVENIRQAVGSRVPMIAKSGKPFTITLELQVKTVKPTITIDKVNSLGIKELVAVGTSVFPGSIANRIYNINLASSRINGTLIKPNETFSFAKTVGDISALSGYKQAYIIENGKTILGDGGGVCQVSTTLFRAAVNAGLPIIERNPHAYRVHYYEEDSLPGFDAAVYVPSVDLKFKNDTGRHLLIQTIFDQENLRLTFELYGTMDGREVIVNKPVIVSQSPAPESLFQDDPNIPKGEVRQIDWAAPGTVAYFTRQVKKDGKIILSDKFTSNYRPWRAIFLRGTKEG